MSKRKKLRDQRSVRHVSVLDAAQVIAGARAATRLQYPLLATPGDRKLAEVTEQILGEWDKSPVVLRVDMEFAQALLDSDTDVETSLEFLQRVPFDVLACSFPTPISLHDGQQLCHYTGFLAIGMKQHVPVLIWDNNGDHLVRGSVFNEFVPFRLADGVRFMWIFTEEGNPKPSLQEVSLDIAGGLRTEEAPRTLREFIEERLVAAEDKEFGIELGTLVPLSIQLLLYLAGQDPDDLDWPAPETISRPQQLQHARIGHVGWRVGAALRNYRETHAAAGDGSGQSGWRLPPHIRKAHWHRVRVAERNEHGVIVGRRDGAQGIDWHYEPRWYPPTPVNADEGGRVAPAVRPVATTELGRSLPS